MKKLLTILFSLISSVAFAQITTNPKIVQFDYDAFVTASRYDGGYFQLLVLPNNTCDLVSPAATTPTQIDNLGNPSTTNGVAIVANIVAKPIGCYVYKVRVLDVSGLFSEWSLQSNPFVTTPAAARNVVMK